jgi:hypothetical protein
MAGWNATMPTDFTDGQTVNESHLDPIVNNVAWLRYATVFQAGQQRVTALGSIVGTEVAALQTPSIVQESGYLYKIEGMLKVRSSVANDTAEVRVHQGAGTAGTVLQSFAAPTLAIADAGYEAPFSVYVKSLSQTAAIYTLGVRRLTGTGNLTADTTSWIAVLRSGDNALMSDV